MLAEPTAAQRECWRRCPTPPTPRCCTPTPRCCRAPAAPGRPGTSCGRAATGTGHGHLRPDPAAAAADRDPLPGHPRRRAPRRPGHGDRPDGVRAPALHPVLGRRPAPAARDRHRPGRLRRRLPRLGLPRGRRALRARRGRAAGLRAGSRRARPVGSTSEIALVERGRAAPSRDPTGIYDAPSRHTRRKPFKRPSPTAPTSGWSTSTTCPTTACSAGSRRATTSVTRRTIRENLDASWRRARHRRHRRPGADGRQRRAPSATASTRSACSGASTPRGDRRPDGGRGAQHLRRPARLPRPPRRAGPGDGADKAMYVSPFHGTDGRYELAVPVPGERLRRRGHPAHRRRRRSSAPRCRHRVRRAGRSRAAPAAMRGAALIRTHGIWLWLRRLPVRPRPDHHQEGVSSDHCPHPSRRPTPGRGLDDLPTGPRAAVAARVARRLFRAAVSRLARDRRTSDRRETVGRGGPEMTRAPAGRVLRPDRPRPADRLRRGLPDRRLGRRGPRRLPHRARRRDRAPGAAQPLQKLRALVVAPPPRAAARSSARTPRATSPTTTTCPTTSSSSSSTRP